LDMIIKKDISPLSIVRLDGGYLSAELLNYIFNKKLSVVMGARYDWVLAQKPKIDDDKWQDYDDKTKIYDLGMATVISTVKRDYRIILVIKEQETFKPDKRKKVKKVKYAIIENIPLRLDAFALYDFYCSRQTIENFFKEVKNPFNAGKMPSQKFKGCEAYLQYAITAYNLFRWFKKNFSQCNGENIAWRPLES